MILCNMHVQTDIRIGYRDIRTLASRLAKLVNNRIFYFVGYKLRMAEFFGEDNRVNGKGLVLSDIL